MARGRKEIKELKKYALKLSNITWKNKIQCLVLLLLSFLCIGYIISTGVNFIIDRRELSQEVAGSIRVEVLNGTSVDGLAERVASYLKFKGFDVIGFGNASKCSLTVIFDRSDIEKRNANFVRNALKYGTLEFEVHPVGLVDVTVFLGADYREIRTESRAERKLQQL